MRLLLSYKLFPLSGVLLMTLSNLSSAAPSVLPPPAQITLIGERLRITDSTAIYIRSENLAADRFAAEEFNRWLEELGFSRLPVRELAAGESAPPGSVTLDGSSTGVAAGDGGYTLEVDSAGARIEAPSEAGRFYGLMTLAQVFGRDSSGVYVPGLSVKDRPALGLRGVSDDLSRGQISTLDDLKALVRLLARYKLNL
ncbi:MAG: glycoside hydrolase family 20 zincin-like fold domain-containing protein, partial [Candidatus Glassbacteria bacterium]